MDKLKFIFSAISEFLWPFIKIFLSKFGPILATAALDAVKLVAENYSKDSSSDKQKTAHHLILQSLKSQGIAIGADITSSMINAAIEAAVQKLKSETSPINN
jgi:hypothetical protein